MAPICHLDPDLRPLDISLDPDLQTIRRYHTFKGLVGGGFRHCVRRVAISFNPPNLSQFPTFVRLTKSHNVDHKPLLFGCSELDEAFVEGEAVGAYNDGEGLSRVRVWAGFATRPASSNCSFSRSTNRWFPRIRVSSVCSPTIPIGPRGSFVTIRHGSYVDCSIPSLTR